MLHHSLHYLRFYHPSLLFFFLLINSNPLKLIKATRHATPHNPFLHRHNPPCACFFALVTMSRGHCTRTSASSSNAVVVHSTTCLLSVAGHRLASRRCISAPSTVKLVYTPQSLVIGHAAALRSLPDGKLSLWCRCGIIDEWSNGERAWWYCYWEFSLFQK